MDKLSFNELTFFEKVAYRKRLFCAKVIVRLDRIITFCASKQELQEVNEEIQDVKNFKKFSKTFYENKDNLEEKLVDIKNKHRKYENDIYELFCIYSGGNFSKMENIFKKYGLKTDETIKD